MVGSLITDETMTMDGTGGPDYAAMTFDELVESLGLPIPTTRQVVSWLPTTPLAGHKIMERRKPYTTARDSPGTAGGNGNRDSFAGSPNRTARNRQARDRTARDRQASDRTAGERAVNERVQRDRTAAERTGTERQVRERTAPGERGVRTRVNRERTVQDRSVADIIQDTALPASASVPESNSPATDPAAESDIFAPVTEALQSDPQGDLSVSTKRSASESKKKPPSQTWIRSGQK